MRIRIYIDGKPSWSENEPGHAVLYRGSIRGELVTGSAGATENERARKRVSSLTANQRKLDDRPIVNGRPRIYATDEERLAARRKTYRESSRRARTDAA